MAQNLFVTIVSIATLSLSLLILSAFLLVFTNLQQIIVTSTQSLSVSAYLSDDLSPESLTELKKKVSNLPQVVKINYISKPQALADLKRRLGTQANLLDGIEENPLPASLDIWLKPEYKSPDQIKVLIDRLKGMHGVTDVDYAWEWAERLTRVFNFFKLVGLIIGGLLFLATIFIISNTIRLTLYSRQEEVHILRLIGATEGFIRTPFFIEGLLQGLAGGLTAVLILFLLFKLLVSQITFPLGLSLFNFSFLAPTATWGIVGSGLFLGFLGSLVSLGRFMR